MQSAFLKDVLSLTVVIEDMGNPFLEERKDLLVVDTKDQYIKFIDELLSTCVTDPVPKIKRLLSSHRTVEGPST